MLALAFAVLSMLPPDPNTLPRRDHGPGTAGGGLSTVSGETLKPGAVSVALRLDYTQFERLSDADINQKTLKVDDDHVHFDAVRWSLLETFEFAFGAAEDFQIAYSFGYYRANEVREGHVHGSGTYGFHAFGDVSGMTDHWLTAKGRLLKGPEGSVAVFGGVKFPFGDEDEVDEGSTGGNNQPLEPALQPGSGTFDAMVGAAYSRFLSEHLTLDTSASYTYRSEEDEFKIGDLVLFGVALAYRFTENVLNFPQTSVFLEANVRHLSRNKEDHNTVLNSGGTVLFLSPGVRYGFSERASFTLAFQIPVVQDLNDEQQETDFKVSTGIVFSL